VLGQILQKCCEAFLQSVAKPYIREPGTDQMVRLTARKGNRFVLLAIAQAEFRVAVRRRQRAKIGLRQDFAMHFDGFFLRQAMSAAVIDSACGLTDNHPLRAYDAIQLAGCLALRSSNAIEHPVFVCSDNDLLAAAEAEGLLVWNPAAGPRNSHPPLCYPDS
jgi:predicted nucleic acid-binding protein